MANLSLVDGWKFKVYDPNYSPEQNFTSQEGWLPATVPGTVQQDLMAAGSILDPFYGKNEQAVQWIGESDWLYQCYFDLPTGFESLGATQLCFDGLDTFATVWLNGQQILTTDNMFVPHRVEVGALLRPAGNQLQILFESVLRRGNELEAQYGKLAAWNGATSRLYVRKAQYHYGWDWGPVFLTAGIWQQVRLESFDSRIAEMNCPIEVADDLSHATIQAQLNIDIANDASSDGLAITLQLWAPDGSLVEAAAVPVVAGVVQYTFEVNAPQLWFPHGYGAQPLYRVTASLKHNGAELDQREQRLGLRRLRLVQEPVQHESGTSFFFEVNNIPIFCGGANWIPADSFTPRITTERYRTQLQMAVDAHMVMLRVWGGGIYEDDRFYDLCDELGLLVWQDFMFACGIYPAHDWFQQSIKAEAEVAVTRLRHHACLAIWAGNNEDYAIAESLKLYDPTFEGDFTQTSFPARAIYEKLLPEICARLDPGRAYWPGSPYGGATSADPTIGDKHTWDIWHGAMADYHDYPKYEGRFVSEFGMEALPALSTIKSFAPEGERYPYSRTLEFHNRADGGQRRLAAYLTDNLPLVSELEDYLYATQFIQSEALSFALRGWRRRWGGPSKYAVSGALVWQLNDCWPVTSWAIVDYALHAKPAYYTLRREMAPITLGLWDNRYGTASFWGVSSLDHAVEGILRLTTWDLNGQQIAESNQPVTLESNRATEWGELAYKAEAGLVVSATFISGGSTGGQVLARATLWPEPFKYLRLPDPELQVMRLADDKVQVQVARPAKGVFLWTDKPLNWSDNMLDLMPGEPRIVEAPGLGTAALTVRTLNDIYR